MGWIGPAHQIEHALRTVGADRDEKGRYNIYGEHPVSFLGLGEEIVIPDGAEYSINGHRASLAGLLNSTSYGVRNITVIS